MHFKSQEGIIIEHTFWTVCKIIMPLWEQTTKIVFFFIAMIASEPENEVYVCS